MDPTDPGPQHCQLVMVTGTIVADNQPGECRKLQDHGAGAGGAGQLDGVDPLQPGAQVDPGVGQPRRGVEGGQEAGRHVHRHVEQLAPVPLHPAFAVTY
jgi:hypothetical protein